MYAHTFYNILFRIPSNSILWSSPYTVSLTHSVNRGENCISLLGITGYAIIQVDGKYVTVEILLSAVPFGDVKHTGDAILRGSKQQLAGYGVGQYE
jgi:hypothetical protein